MMSDRDFDQQLQQIEEQYAHLREGAEAFRDQEVSRLFVACGWTQVRIAKKMGRNQSWVARHLLFGRFLRIMPPRHNHESPLYPLTEWRFRQAWSEAGRRPKESEDERFGRVLARLQESAPAVPKGYQNLVKKPGIRKAVIEVLKGGGRHNVEQLATALQEELPGTDTKQVSTALSDLQKKPPKGFAVEARHTGRTHKYRLVPRKGAASTVRSLEEAGATVADILPMLREAQAELKKSMAAMSPTLIQDHLWRIEQALSRLLVPAEVV
jgi:hypothetical protein